MCPCGSLLAPSCDVSFFSRRVQQRSSELSATLSSRRLVCALRKLRLRQPLRLCERLLTCGYLSLPPARARRFPSSSQLMVSPSDCTRCIARASSPSSSSFSAPAGRRVRVLLSLLALPMRGTKSVVQPVNARCSRNGKLRETLRSLLRLRSRPVRAVCDRLRALALLRPMFVVSRASARPISSPLPYPSTDFAGRAADMDHVDQAFHASS